jgi:hypothetical protein
MNEKYKCEDQGPGWPRHKTRPYLKNNAKKAGRVFQVVKYLSSKRKALSSNSRTIVRKKCEILGCHKRGDTTQKSRDKAKFASTVGWATGKEFS